VTLTKGLILRYVGFCVGIIALAVFFKVANVASDTENSTLLVYVLIGANYLGYYVTGHADEILPESKKTDQR
jgi:hypothetical protein